jgi:hypothetical protein
MRLGLVAPLSIGIVAVVTLAVWLKKGGNSYFFFLTGSSSLAGRYSSTMYVKP